MRLEENMCNSRKTGKLDCLRCRLRNCSSKFTLTPTISSVAMTEEIESKVVGFVGVEWVFVSCEDELQNQNNCRKMWW